MHAPPVASLKDLARPLSNDEWVELTDVLDVGDGPDIDYCVGFLTAIASATSLIPPSEWLPVVLGNRMLDSPGDPHLGLIFRLYNTIVTKLSSKEVYHPPADETDRIETWCRGYREGVRHDDVWTNTFEAMRPVFPIAVLAGDVPLNDPDDEDRIEDEEAWKQKAREDLGSLALEAFMKLRAARQGGTPKIGRNDPCPCGSGKKYKRCCLGKDGAA
jgi:uncharacterized protein